jgi:hypothetical protein
VLGLVGSMDFSKRFTRFLLLWVTVPALALFAVSPGGYFYYRLMYLVPVQVLAAVGLYWIINRLCAAMDKKDSRVILAFKLILVVLVIVFMLNYALRSVDETVLYMP